MSLTLLRTDTKFNIKSQAPQTWEMFEKVNTEMSI